jgi:hypothetical protein
MRVGVVLSTHENSEIYRDTLESVQRYLSDDVVTLTDGFAWKQFSQTKSDIIEGFRHGKPSAPVRNVALGMMGAWERWGSDVDWYCYMEYDCLVGSGEILDHLRSADENGYWMLGNDLRTNDFSIGLLDDLAGAPVSLHYLLGCCCFFSRKFMRALTDHDLFGKLLKRTNFFPIDSFMVDGRGRPFPIHDVSEFIYPSLAVHYGGAIQQFANWNSLSSCWEGNFNHYPMRFTPDLCEQDPVREACIMHPVKSVDGPIRTHYRNKRRGIIP